MANNADATAIANLTGGDDVRVAWLHRSVGHVQKVALPWKRHLLVACIQQARI
jgi:hypothetical protein